MLEKFPHEVPKKIDGNENSERPPRYRTINTEIVKPLKDGTETVRVTECNGIQHRRCVDQISYDGNGEITYVDQLSREELGPCD